MAHYAHGRRRHNFVELETKERTKPSPEEEVGLVEDHPRDEDRTDQADHRRSDGTVGDDDSNQRRQDAENHLQQSLYKIEHACPLQRNQSRPLAQRAVMVTVALWDQLGTER